MYKVNNALTSAYGPLEMELKPKQGPAGDAMEKPIGRPLRYTPGLRCDAHLESLRPERSGLHRAIQGGEDWKRKLVQPPNHFEGSFVDADMQQFRPEPVANPVDDPWYASRCPEQTMVAYDRLSAPAATYNYPELPLSGPYGAMYPQDELSRIKMRNRRFMNACAQEMGGGMMTPMGPMMMMQQQPQQPPPMMWGPPTLDHELAGDELSILDQELNVTRRANRPFIPMQHPDYFSLQRQVQDMEQPPETQRKPVQEVTSVEQLPLPKRTVRTTAESAAVPSNRPQVNIADQIAIRSFVLGQNLGKGGATKSQ